jgi:hypothetical protein
MSVIGIGKNDLEPWLLMKKDNDILLFGRIIDDSSLTYNDLTIQLISYPSENELQEAVDTLVGESGYYQYQAEHVNIGIEDQQEEYLGTSVKYPPL